MLGLVRRGEMLMRRWLPPPEDLPVLGAAGFAAVNVKRELPSMGGIVLDRCFARREPSSLVEDIREAQVGGARALRKDPDSDVVDKRELRRFVALRPFVESKKLTVVLAPVELDDDVDMFVVEGASSSKKSKGRWTPVASIRARRSALGRPGVAAAVVPDPMVNASNRRTNESHRGPRDGGIATGDSDDSSPPESSQSVSSQSSTCPRASTVVCDDVDSMPSER